MCLAKTLNDSIRGRGSERDSGSLDPEQGGAKADSIYGTDMTAIELESEKLNRYKVSFVRPEWMGGKAKQKGDDWWKREDAWLGKKQKSVKAVPQLAPSVVIGGKRPLKFGKLEVKGKHKWEHGLVILEDTRIGVYHYRDGDPIKWEGVERTDKTSMPLCGCTIENLDDYKGGKHKHAWKILFPADTKLEPLFLQAHGDKERKGWWDEIDCCAERAEIALKHRNDAIEEERFMAETKAITDKQDYENLLKRLDIVGMRDTLAKGSWTRDVGCVTRVVDVGSMTEEQCMKLGMNPDQVANFTSWIKGYNDQIAQEFARVVEDMALPPDKQDAMWDSCSETKMRWEFVRLERERAQAEATAEAVGRGHSSATFYSRELALFVGCGPRGNQITGAIMAPSASYLEYAGFLVLAGF